MKKLMLILIVTLLTIAVYSQQAHLTKEQYEQKADSVMTVRVLQKMQSLFTLSAKQQQAIREATSVLNRQRRDVFVTYRNTPSWQQQIERQEQVRDSVYGSIVGVDNYTKYKAAVLQERQQKQAAMEQRIKAKFGTIDTTINKPASKPNIHP